MSEDTTFQIRDLHRTPEGYWQARVVTGETSAIADRKFGSWMFVIRDEETGRETRRCEVKAILAARLQEKVRKRERLENRPDVDEAVHNFDLEAAA